MGFFDDLFGGGGTKTQTATTSSTSEIPPWAAEYYQGQIQERSDLYGLAQTLYNQNVDYQTYDGARLQGFTDDQLNAFQSVRDSQGTGTGDLAAARDLFGQAAEGYGGTFNPQDVTAQQLGTSYNYNNITPASTSAAQIGTAPQISSSTYNAMQVAPGSVTGRDVYGSNVNSQNISGSNVYGSNVAPLGQLGYSSVNANGQPQAGTSQIGGLASLGTRDFDTAAANKYMNPYTQTALRSTLDEMNRQGDIQRVTDAGRATSRGAFGGSRQAIMDAERERNLERAKGDVTAKAYDSAYAGAQSQFNADTGRLMAADQYNIGTDLTAQSQNAQNTLTGSLANQNVGMQAQLANQQAGINTGQFNLQSGLNAQLANQQNSLQAQLANQQNSLTAAQSNQQYNMAGQLANQQNNLQSQLANQQNSMTGQLANQQTSLSAQQSNQQALAQAAQFGINADMAAQQANQGAYLQTSLANQQATNTANLANQQSTNQMSLANAQNNLSEYQTNTDAFYRDQANLLAAQVQNQNMDLQSYNATRDQFNTDNQMQLAAGAASASLAPVSQSMALQDSNNLLGIGSLQQQFGQQNLNTAYNDFLTQQQYPYQQYGFLQGALSGSTFQPSFGQTTNSTTTSPTTQPSALGQIAGAGIAAAGIFGSNGFNLFGGS